VVVEPLVPAAGETRAPMVRVSVRPMAPPSPLPTSASGACLHRTEPDGKSKYSFAFKCHRDGAMIYSINAIDAHPNAEYHVSFGW
jgi:hypothetical protein